MKMVLLATLVALTPSISSSQVPSWERLEHLTLEDFASSALPDTISSIPYGIPTLTRADVLVAIFEAYPDFVNADTLYLWSLISSEEGCAARDSVDSGAISGGDVVRRVVENGVTRQAEVAVTGPVSYDLLPRSRIIHFSQDSLESVLFPGIDSGSCPYIRLSLSGASSPLVQTFSVELPEELPPLFLGERETRSLVFSSDISGQGLAMCAQMSGSEISVRRRSLHSFDIALQVDRIRIGSKCIQDIEISASMERIRSTITDRGYHLGDYVVTAIHDASSGGWSWGIEIPFIDASGRPGFRFDPITSD